jgi:tetratricopeptide (TPR) repeat protein
MEPPVGKSYTNPFKGLRAYSKDDAGTLFGRERDMVLIHDRLFSGKTTLLFAGSGVGKTSFLRAKLMPETEPSRRVFYHGQWAAEEPLKALRGALPKADPPAAQAAAQPGSPATLRQFFAEDGRDRCILILDQFEEVFQNHAWQKCLEQFLEELCEVINSSDLQVRVLFSMREEFLGELSVFDNRIPDLFNNYYRLKHPNKRDAAEIICNTCALADSAVDEDGLSQLIADLSLVERPATRVTTSVASQDATRLHRDFVFLPYLQLVCRRLWEETQSSPTAAPFLAGYRPGLAARVLKTFCREKLAALDEEQKKTVAAALEYLVTRQDAKVPCELRNLASLTRESPGEIDAALNRLADEDTRIVRITRGADGSKWFELYHDLYAPILSEWKQEFEAELHNQEQKRSRQLVGQAELFLRAAVSMFEDDKASEGRDPVVRLSTWARLVERQGDRGGAARLLRRVLAMQEDRLGDSHPDVASTLAHLARLVKPPGEAERMLRRALQIQESTLGPDHREVATTLIDLARLLRRQRRDESAEPLLRRALAIQDKALGADHPDVISLLTEFTSLLRTRGKVDEANALFRRAVDAPEESRDAELGKWIERTASDLSLDRRFRGLLATIDDLLREIESAPEETQRDRYHATVLLAVEILDGRIDFARHIDPSSYWRLEDDCWLQDVKYSKAYKLWMERGGGVDPQKENEDYIKADEQVCARLLDPGIKATVDEFAPVRDYLNRRYLTQGKLDRTKAATARLLNIKAYHLWETTGLSEAENWSRAERYCESFYGNIVPAVTLKSVEHVRAVLDALEIRHGASRADVAVSCFEMAIAVYFLDPEIVTAALAALGGEARA